MVNLPTRAILEEVLVLRPDNLYVIPTKIRFNRKIFDALEIDLNHINKNRRSNYTAGEVERIVRRALHNNKIEHEDYIRYFGGDCFYYTTGLEIGFLYFKLVFCVCTDRPKRIGVITLHRVRIRK